MLSVLRSFAIILCTFSAASFVAIATESEAEELSNLIVDREPAVPEQVGLPSKEIKLGLKAPDPQNTDIAVSDGKVNNDNVTLEQRFENGVESYLNNDWENCIVEFEKAIKRYCRVLGSDKSIPSFLRALEDLGPG